MSKCLYPTLIADGSLSTPAADNCSTLQKQITSEIDCAVPISCWLQTALCCHLLSIVVAFAFTLIAVVVAQITLGNVVRVYPGTV